MEFKKKSIVFLFFAVLLTIVSSCTITVIHKFEDRYYEARNGTIPNQTGGEVVVPDQVVPSGLQGPITFVNDPDKEETVGISKLILGREEPQFISWLLPTQSVTLQTAKGDVFFFKVKDGADFTLPPYKVEEFGQEHQFEIGLRWKDARTKYARSTNADANRYSFDIFHINPLYIDQERSVGGGKQKQIFESLEEDDRDWRVYDGDVALKKSFNLKVKDSGEGGTETRMYFGSQAFEKGFSANVGISGGAQNAAGSLSVGFEKLSKNESSQGEVFSYSRKADTVYLIDLVPAEAKLHRNFKEAVLKLSVPTSVPSSLAQAKAQVTYGTYEQFIKTWGTHYPTRVHYGGFIVAYKRTSLDEAISEDGWSIKVGAKASVPAGAGSVGVEGGFGYSEKEKYLDRNSTEETGYFHVGGRGDDGSWNVGDQVQPIKIQLARLDELLTPLFFKDEALSAELAGRRSMLKYALEDYIGSQTDAGKILTPRIFKIVPDYWKLIKGDANDSEFSLYGVIGVGALARESSKEQSKDIWLKDKENPVVAKKGVRNSFSSGNEIISIVYPSNGAYLLGREAFAITAGMFWKNPYLGGWDHCIGFSQQMMSFDKLNFKPQPFQIQFRAGKYECNRGLLGDKFDSTVKDGKWEVDVVTNVYEVEFSKLGFDGL